MPTRECVHCGDYFSIGGHTSASDVKQASAMYCSDQCRLDHHNERRKAFRNANQLLNALDTLIEIQASSDKYNCSTATRLRDILRTAADTGNTAAADKAIKRLKEATY